MIHKNDYAEGRLTPAGVRYHVCDRLGSVKAVVDGVSGAFYSAKDYSAYGAESVSSTVTTSPSPAGETYREGFTGQEELEPDFGLPYTDFGARHYAPSIRRWLTPDPLSEKYYSISPYAYCAGNPVNLVDPQGEDVYRFDKESGDFILYQKTEDNYDMVGKFRKESDGSFTLKYKKNGAPKEIIGHVEKGILSDGINFKNQDHVFEVSEITGLTLKGVETFLIEITGLVNKEVGGYYYSVLGNGEITHVSVGKYYNNES